MKSSTFFIDRWKKLKNCNWKQTRVFYNCFSWSFLRLLKTPDKQATGSDFEMVYKNLNTLKVQWRISSQFQSHTILSKWGKYKDRIILKLQQNSPGKVGEFLVCFFLPFDLFAFLQVIASIGNHTHILIHFRS